ncbi:hypothetical protein [uncultured Phycicoccus sp.]|uniref:hypothetical protein n=1 Tax=uncultured Phycicoccus sp. TaxID=661422 RepID=UPI00260FC160|nr:hypothetical protein [uncultured Phycicoccus sp.]
MTPTNSHPTPDDDRETLRTFARRLFSDPDAPAETDAEADEGDPALGNVSPREGMGAAQPADPRADMAAFARALFGRDW